MLRAAAGDAFVSGTAAVTEVGCSCGFAAAGFSGSGGAGEELDALPLATAAGVVGASHSKCCLKVVSSIPCGKQ